MKTNPVDHRIILFNSVCEKIGMLEDEIVLPARALFDSLKDKASADDLSRGDDVWVACALYLVGHKANVLYAIPLHTLLKVTNVGISDFINKTKTFCTLVNPEKELLTLVDDLERRFYTTTVTFRKFVDVYETIFVKTTVSLPSDDMFKFNWLLFVLCKAELLPRQNDLVNCIHLLICCLGYVSSHCQEQLLTSEYRKINVSDRLAHLCNKFSASIDQNYQVQGFFNSFLSSLLGNKTDFIRIADLDYNYIDKYTAEYSRLLANVYSKNHLLPTDFDERSCIEPSFVEQFSSQQEKLNENNLQANQSESMSILTETLGTEPIDMDKLDPKMMLHVRKCAENPMESLSTRISDLKKAFLEKFCFIAKHPNDSEAEIQAKQQELEKTGTFLYNLAAKLYLQVLTAMLENESRRGNAYLKIFSLDKLHRSLLAVSLEIVFVSCQSYQVSFDDVISMFELSPFEFVKVIEVFIRYEPMLNREHIKHLGQIEEEILEERVWRSDSRFFEMVDTSESFTVPSWTESAANSTTNTPVKKTTLSTPTKRSHSVAAALMTASTNKKESDLFFRKVYKLFYVRMNSLAEHLQIYYNDVLKIWTLIEFTLTNHYELLKDRHIDQILISSIYGVMCISGNPISFKTIIANYRLFPRSQSTVYRNVLLEDGTKKHIISFYNEVFMPKVRDFILSLSDETPNAKRPCLSPLPASSARSGVAASPLRHKVSKDYNVFISPCRLTPSQARAKTMTPRSKQLFCFVGESPLSSPSKQLSSINNRVNNCKPTSAKHLQFHNASRNSKGRTSTFSKRLQVITDETGTLP